MLSTGIFEPQELVAMALPLALALGVEARRLSLGRFERWINTGALVYAVVLILLRVQLLTGVTHLLFLLCASRLALPRSLGQRRQILLMGFLLFLISALAVFDLVFALWLVLWLILSMTLLMQQAWEQSARHHPTPPPFKRLLPFTLVAVVLGAACFVAMPRVTFGIRSPWLGGLGWGRSTAGFSDRVDLAGEGPVAANAEVVLRIIPLQALAEDPALARRQLGLLRGTALEEFEGGAWQPLDATPRTSFTQHPFASATLEAEFFLSASPKGLVPHPYGILQLPGQDDLSIEPLRGGGLRLRQASRQMVPLSVRFQPIRGMLLEEPPPTGRRRAFLKHPGEGTEHVHQWALGIVPEGTPAPETAKALAARLRTFRYTLDNPSGKAEDPLRDFLFRTQAGHCEYFASTLALALRHRGFPARVVNGYQLGAWVPEGGYYVVTQNEAHSWVEYYDEGLHGWKAVDGTPPTPGQAWAAETLRARMQRWADAVQFRWDRYVVRFSDADQVAGFAWFQGHLERLKLPASLADPLRPVGWVALALLAIRLAWRFRSHGWRWSSATPGHLPELRPLVRRIGALAPPLPGETARGWLLRLANLRPERRESLSRLADLADQTAYGDAVGSELKPITQTETQAWRGWKPSAPRA